MNLSDSAWKLLCWRSPSEIEQLRPVSAKDIAISYGAIQLSLPEANKEPPACVNLSTLFSADILPASGTQCQTSLKTNAFINHKTEISLLLHLLAPLMAIIENAL
ncbi:MAG: hypothetical protein AAF609_24430 [Cyanobacteria bacterium P01_C01_bin.120]